MPRPTAVRSRAKKDKPSKASSASTSTSPPLTLSDLLRLPAKLLLDPAYAWVLASLVLVGEIVLNLVIIHRVPYTEIDWKAYMQQVTTFLQGERDYTQIRGDTGPLVYPAGFLYIYSALYYLTQKGTNLRIAQYIFVALYVVTMAIVSRIYSYSKKVPPFLILLLCLSKRLHSIYVLRLFNDPFAMVFLYGSILALLQRRWTWSCLLYSAALSIKMNILLFFPGFAVILWMSLGAWATFARLALIAAVQVLVALPFEPMAYMSRAFEFSRVFDYQWTVNWRMVDEKTFVSPQFARLLLAGQAAVLILFLTNDWCKKQGGMIHAFLAGFKPNGRVVLTSDEMLVMLFSSNLIGVAFARSLHYQFYSWYYHTLPYLCWQSPYRTFLRSFLLATIESCWLTFPSTENSSWTLFACHMCILVGLLNRHEHTRQDYEPPRFKDKT
ncbi:glycosyltransferase [Gongronella butleri]|nr:glycosyltransferase [Gongronella butleri]